MPCGLNSAPVNTYEINGCEGTIVVRVAHWIDEVIPKVLAYTADSKGLVTCLTPKQSHDSVSPTEPTVLPSGGKREC